LIKHPTRITLPAGLPAFHRPMGGKTGNER
jgi:hypothetical protein